jgi:hypothetical protein
MLSGTTQHELDVQIVSTQLFSLGYSIPVLTELLSDLSTQVCDIDVTLLSRANTTLCEASVCMPHSAYGG